MSASGRVAGTQAGVVLVLMIEDARIHNDMTLTSTENRPA